MREHEPRTPPRDPIPPPPPDSSAGAASDRDTRRHRDAGAPEERSDQRVREPLPDIVYDASVESFPASDPPSWIGMRLGQPRR